MLAGLVAVFGSIKDTRHALDELRLRARRAGCGELHLNAVLWGEQMLPGEEKIEDVNGLLQELGFDSISSYVWVHHQPMNGFPTIPYAGYREASVRAFRSYRERYRLPYYPNVTMGWDSTPRTVQSDAFENIGYPYTPILEGNTPDEFELTLRAAKEFLHEGKTRPLVFTINAWNEWTEGSYLDPDTDHGMGCLDAVRRVFGVS
jgi:hypothetical protein